jgi:hypothetical protein
MLIECDGKFVKEGFVSGHDLSRADKANKKGWALAPDGRTVQAQTGRVPHP